MYQSWFEKLRFGLLFALEKQRAKEPGYDAINQYSFKASKFSRASQYAGDIERIKKELYLSYSLICEPPDEVFFVKHKTTKEDYIMYNQGYFLDLVHQLKDKLMKLIDVTSTLFDERIDKKYREPKKLKIQKISNLAPFVRVNQWASFILEWDDNADGSVGVVLRKRKNFHHSENTLPLNPSFQDVKLFRTMQAENAQKLLSEFGKQMIYKRGESGMEKFQQDVLGKLKNTIEAIDINLEKISKLLCKYCNLPKATNKNGVRAVSVFLYGGSDKEIKNNTSKDNFNDDFYYYPVIEAFKETLDHFFSSDVQSFYLIGSVARGEHVPVISDINLVLILNDVSKENLELIEGLKNRLFKVSEIDIDLNLLSAEQFLSEENFKLRFICKTDGLLLSGVDLLKNEIFPKPGLGLAFVLNSDYKDIIGNFREQVINNRSLNQLDVSKIAVRVCKNFLRVMFSEIMSNYAVYTREISRMKEYINFYHPESKMQNARLHAIIKGSRHVDKDGLLVLLDAFSEKFFPLIDSIESKSEYWYKNWKKDRW
jgi:predicted nucleotidyltransferase